MNILITIEIIAMVLSIVGQVFVVHKNRRGFGIWIIANIFWIIFALVNKHYFMLILFLFYTMIALWGFLKWKKKRS